MTVGIVGLGLIGGSMAKAFSKAEGVRVLGLDTDRSILGFAILSGAVHGELTREELGECDLLLLAAYPQAAEDYLRREAPYIRRDTVVMDCLGTKRPICAAAFPENSVALLILVIGPLIELPTLALAANLRLGRRRRLGLQ